MGDNEVISDNASGDDNDDMDDSKIIFCVHNTKDRLTRFAGLLTYCSLSVYFNLRALITISSISS